MAPTIDPNAVCPQCPKKIGRRPHTERRFNPEDNQWWCKKCYTEKKREDLTMLRQRMKNLR